MVIIWVHFYQEISNKMVAKYIIKNKINPIIKTIIMRFIINKKKKKPYKNIRIKGVNLQNTVIIQKLCNN